MDKERFPSSTRKLAGILTDSFYEPHAHDFSREQGESYLPYDEYVEALKEYGIQYIPPIAIIDNPMREDLERCLEESNFLNNGNPGEGIVISRKNNWPAMTSTVANDRQQ